MKRNIVAICDSEQAYAYRLMDALSRMADFPYELLTFTSAELLHESLRENGAQVLLIAQSDFREEMRDWAPYIILLWEDPVAARTDLPGISKYTSVVRIMKKITETASDAGAALPLPKTDHPVHFLGFYTPVGRSLQTTLAFAAGQLLARSHKALYLNFERFSGLESVLSRTFSSDFSDLLYYLPDAAEDFLRRLYQAAEPVNGMEAVPPALSGADIVKTDAEEWKRLLEILMGSRYDYVILDLSDCVQGLFELLRSCSRVYTIVKEDHFAAAKLFQYEEELRRRGFEDVLQKTKRCRLPVFTRLPGDFNHLMGSELARFAERMLAEDGQDGV